MLARRQHTHAHARYMMSVCPCVFRGLLWIHLGYPRVDAQKNFVPTFFWLYSNTLQLVVIWCRYCFKLKTSSVSVNIWRSTVLISHTNNIDTIFVCLDGIIQALLLVHQYYPALLSVFSSISSSELQQAKSIKYHPDCVCVLLTQKVNNKNKNVLKR